MLRRCAVERDERDLADALDQHWDALLRGEVPAVTADLDADLVALVAGLQAAGSALPSIFPDPHQAWRDLRQMPPPPTRGWSDAETPLPTWIHPNGHVDLVGERRLATARPRRRGGWALG